MSRLQHTRSYAFRHFPQVANKRPWLDFIATLVLVSLFTVPVFYLLSERELKPSKVLANKIMAGTLSPADARSIIKQLGGGYE